MQRIGRELYTFEEYTLDLIRGCVRDTRGEIPLRPKSFALLRYLLQNPGRLISKDELVDAVWPNVIVGDDSLAQCMSELRNALNDRDRHIIRTVPRRGYLFAASISITTEDHPIQSGAVTVASPSTPLPLPDQPSIAVLPFANISGDPEQECFSEGIADDIITNLSRCRWFFVIARNSSFTFKQHAVDVKRIGSELGARYVLEGSVRRIGARIRITAQLVEAETAKHVWA